MEAPIERLLRIHDDSETAGWIRVLISRLLEEEPVAVAEDLERLAGLFQLRADWERGHLHYDRPSPEGTHHFVDAMMIATNPEGTEGVAVWQGHAGLDVSATDLLGQPIVDGAWYVVAKKNGRGSIVSGPLYPLGTAAEAAARFLRRQRGGLADDALLEDVASRRMS